MQVSNAQVKSLDAAKAAVESAQAAADNAKKATKVATWIKLGQSYMDAYSAPQGAAWVGANKAELALILRGQKVLSSETVNIGGKDYVKDSYATCDYYYDGDVLSIIDVTKPVYEDALDKALKAYAKAAEVDPKGTKTKDIVTAIKGIAEKYNNDAYNQYSLGDYLAASKLFEKAVEASGTAPVSQLDTNGIYNAGFTAHAGGDYEKAKSLFRKCIDYGYYANDGDAFAKLADVMTKLGDAEASKEVLEEGFKAFPQSQSILIGLINYYEASGKDTDRLFELIDEAKKNEPNNASLYYVEGNIRKQLGDFEGAQKAYLDCANVNPAYEFAYIGLGVLLYDKAVAVQEEANNEFDDAKYMKLVADFEKYLKGCVEPFEKAIEISSDDSVKSGVAEFLKNACYRFRDDAEYGAKYEKYSKMAAGE